MMTSRIHAVASHLYDVRRTTLPYDLPDFAQRLSHGPECLAILLAL